MVAYQKLNSITLYIYSASEMVKTVNLILNFKNANYETNSLQLH